MSWLFNIFKKPIVIGFLLGMLVYTINNYFFQRTSSEQFLKTIGDSTNREILAKQLKVVTEIKQSKKENVPSTRKIIKAAIDNKRTIFQEIQKKQMDKELTEIEKIELYEEYITGLKSNIVNQLSRFNELKDYSLEWKLKNAIKPYPLEEWPTELVLALSYIVDLSYEETMKMKVEEFNLSKEHLRVIRNYSESNDLALMIKRNELTREYLEYNNLRKYYPSK